MAPSNPMTPTRATGRSRFRRSLRICAAASLAVTVSLTTAGIADAAPKPSAAAAKKKLATLSPQLDKKVDQYNKTKTELDAAKKRLKVLQAQKKSEQATYDQLHARVVQLVANEYKTGQSDPATAVLASHNPDQALDQMSTFMHLASNRGQELTAFLASTQRLQRDLAAVQSTVQDVSQKAAALKSQKASLEKQIAEQRKLEREAGETTPSGSGKIGGTYTGPASGSARAALSYAYAQLGKPYIYGGTGPKGYDCSGLTMMSWRAAGVSLPRVVPDQYNATRRVAQSDAQPGDLIFFSGLGHVGIVVDSGHFIHAPRTGENVMISPIAGYWQGQIVGFGRP
ncbi:C40 family peptidase [Actinoallomurus rhizosphaericola]|uniref:C40 family peptidase n=1 Tax=Actinoallomurus rhizosphaericola TaxID=2952536 RepID=UPI002092841F|nr:NlpC/P60 family protein [Actinoallomurus rhizosphaericola]MCO5995990.1 NlpC/P60 family protein [Actinoallomurus rhizosphaericola]